MSDRVLLAILAVAALLRFYAAGTEPYIHDEDNNAIALARTISLTTEHVNLPLRGESHGALPAYVVRIGSTIFGESRLGYRAAHVILGLVTVLLIARLARQGWGPAAARWAAALAAFNEYSMMVSSRATAHVPYHLFVVCAVYAFARFLKDGQPRHLYLAAASVGLAFYCKEHAALLLPIFVAVVLLSPGHRRWLASPHPYAAVLVFTVMLAPDLSANVSGRTTETVVTYSGEPHQQNGYARHLRRIGGVGVSPYPAMFYARSLVQQVHAGITGAPLPDHTVEYRSLGSLLGLLLLGGVVLSTVRGTSDPVRTLLLCFFWGIFAFFTLVTKGEATGRLDPVSWIWVEATIVPAVVFTAVRLSDATGIARRIAWGAAAALLVYANLALLGRLGAETMELVLEVPKQVNHYLGLAAEFGVRQMLAHPLRTLLIAVAAGLMAGFIAGWLARGRRR